MVWFCEVCQAWYLRPGCYARHPGHHDEHYWADFPVSEDVKDEAERNGVRIVYPNAGNRLAT